MTLSKDEDSIEAFPSKGADDPLADSVRPRCSNRGLDDPDAFRSEHLVKGDVNLQSRSRIKNLIQGMRSVHPRTGCGPAG